jgi:tRNA threonylcarbamoyl adenosine modification protein YeaZ
MLILAFDTTSENGGAGIFRDSQCLASAAAAEYVTPTERAAGSMNYSVVLFQMVDHLLAQPGLKLRDIELFAVANGPGSFTGIRVGLAAALAWTQAFGRLLCGVSVLEAMVEEEHPETEWALPIADARRGEFFAAVFRPPRLGDRRSATGHPVLRDEAESQFPLRGVGEPAGSRFPVPGVGEGFLFKQEALEGLLSILGASGAVTCVARGHDIRAQALLAEMAVQEPRRSLENGVPAVLEREAGSRGAPGCVRRRTVSGTLVSAIARLALRAHAEGRLQSTVDAFYIRRPDAETRWQDD